MKNLKMYIFILIVMLICITIPSICNATTYEYKSKTSNDDTINWNYELDNNNEIINLRCKNVSSISGTVEVPSTIEEKTVRKLGGNKSEHAAFKGASGLTEIKIPNTVTYIGYEAFSGCSGISSVVIPDSVTEIANAAFYDCHGIKTLTFGKNLHNIGERAFSNCSGLKSLILPDSVTSIGNSAFYHCSGIKELILSKKLTKIDMLTFSGCTGLTSVIIPDSVTTIEGSNSITGAFLGCTNLNKILIPDSVVSIGKLAFDGCNKLTIYGNDNQVSKQHAEERNINFDYISNWNITDTGSDVTAPTVKEINIKNKTGWDNTTNTYKIPVDYTLAIVVVFSEDITGTTLPTLTIKCKDGNNIDLTNGEITGNYITYTYKIKSTDNGQISTVKFEGGDITDKTGNKAILSCPALDGSYIVYADGSEDKSTQDTDKDNKSDSISQKNNEDQADDTIKKDDKLPQTGTILISIVIITLLGITITYKIKYGRYKDIA